MHYKAMQFFGFFMCLFLISTAGFADSNKPTVKKCPPNCLSAEEYQEQSTKIKNQINDLDEEINGIKGNLADLKLMISDSDRKTFDSAIQNQSMWLAIFGGILTFFGGLIVWMGFGRIDKIQEMLEERSKSYILSMRKTF